MNNYMDDNPRRLAIKRLYPDLFKQVWNQTIGSTTYACMGNIWLLNRPVRMQITRKQCLELNQMAAEISSVPWSEDMEKM